LYTVRSPFRVVDRVVGRQHLVAWVNELLGDVRHHTSRTFPVSAVHRHRFEQQVLQVSSQVREHSSRWVMMSENVDEHELSRSGRTRYEANAILLVRRRPCRYGGY